MRMKFRKRLRVGQKRERERELKESRVGGKSVVQGTERAASSFQRSAFYFQRSPFSAQRTLCPARRVSHSSPLILPSPSSSLLFPTPPPDPLPQSAVSPRRLGASRAAPGRVPRRRAAGASSARSWRRVRSGRSPTHLGHAARGRQHRGRDAPAHRRGGGRIGRRGLRGRGRSGADGIGRGAGDADCEQRRQTARFQQRGRDQRARAGANDRGRAIQRATCGTGPDHGRRAAPCPAPASRRGEGGEGRRGGRGPAGPGHPGPPVLWSLPAPLPRTLGRFGVSSPNRSRPPRPPG